MKSRPVLLILLFVGALPALYAQSQNRDDAQAARRYVYWTRQAIDEGRWNDALAAIRRAADFASVSSDISFLLGAARLKNLRADADCNRLAVLDALDAAISTNRWELYNADMALLLKAEQHIVMRNYDMALSVLERVREGVYPAGAAPAVAQSSFAAAGDMAADLAFLRLLAFRGLAAAGDVQALARFRGLVLNAMDRFPRDSRPLRVFFEYARNRTPEQSDLPGRGLSAAGDFDLLELALRRLPFLLENDPDLAWMASGFMSDTAAARRLVSSYRAGGLSARQVENFRPNPSSISAALNLGLIDDIAAVEELFFESSANEGPVLYRGIIDDVFNLLRSEQGRDLFTRKMLSFSGTIFSDDDKDGHAERRSVYRSGVVAEFRLDRNQNGIDDLVVFFAADGVPLKALYSAAIKPSVISIDWERYPSVLRAELADEVFLFRPADFQYAPVTFIELGGSQNYSGLAYPVPSYQNIDIFRRSLVSFCASISRPSVEISGAVEQMFLERGIVLRSLETLDGKQVSVTEFERGAPLIQHIDLDLDGRMETIRRFHRPGPDFPWPDSDGIFDFRRLIASSESDWTGEGRYKTGEVYLQDGSVVYSWDMDGSGVMNHSQTETGKE